MKHIFKPSHLLNLMHRAKCNSNSCANFASAGEWHGNDRLGIDSGGPGGRTLMDAAEQGRRLVRSEPVCSGAPHSDSEAVKVS
jgi:hypothetical protein